MSQSLSGRTNDDKQKQSVSVTIAHLACFVHLVAGRPPTWSEYACSPTDVVERSEAVTWRETTIMGRLEETGVWTDERWAPQLQRVTKQPPSLLVSRRE